MWIPERVNQRGRLVPAFQIDECFAKEVRKHKWYLTDRGYIRRSATVKESRSFVLLHHFLWSISGRSPVAQIDHINGNPLDNRLENLRSATTLLNNKNVRIKRKRQQGEPQGVYLRKSGRYRVQVSHLNRRHDLGTYDTAEEASAVYQNAKEILIEFANLPGYENVLTGGKD